MVKAWPNVSVGDDAALTISRSGTAIDTLASDAGAANGTDTDNTPVTVYLWRRNASLRRDFGRFERGSVQRRTDMHGRRGIERQHPDGRRQRYRRCLQIHQYPQGIGPADHKDERAGREWRYRPGLDTVARSASATYSIVAANTGSDAADGARLRDPAPTGLTCTTATCAVTMGTAICPTATGSTLVTALQSAAGVAIPILSADSSIVVTLTCTV